MRDGTLISWDHADRVLRVGDNAQPAYDAYVQRWGRRPKVVLVTQRQMSAIAKAQADYDAVSGRLPDLRSGPLTLFGVPLRAYGSHPGATPAVDALDLREVDLLR